jgi:hypothetical protein
MTDLPRRYRTPTFEEKTASGIKPPFTGDLIEDPDGSLVAWADFVYLGDRWKEDFLMSIERIRELQRQNQFLKMEVDRLKNNCDYLDAQLNKFLPPDQTL